MILTLLTFLLITVALSGYSIVLLAVCAPRAYRNGHQAGWSEGRDWQRINGSRS